MATRNFVDLDLTFKTLPSVYGTGGSDLSVKKNEQAIKNSVKNLILTRHYERPFHSEIGSSVYSLLFELPTYALVALLRREILNTITNFEPRVVVQNIDVGFSPDNHYIEIRIIFNIVNTITPITVELTLDRTR